MARDDAYAAYKVVRNRIRKHRPEQVLKKCIATLNSKEAESLDHMRRFPPWFLFLLMKWAVVDGDYSSPGRKDFGEREFLKLVHLMHEMADAVRPPSEYEAPVLFMRSIAFQQFWFQDSYTLEQVARQSILFGGLEETHRFKERFRTLVGVGIDDFIEIGFFILTRRLVEREPRIGPKWLEPILYNYGEGQVGKVLSYLSLDLGELREYFNQELQGIRSKSHEFYEKTPLLLRPLYREGEEYLFYSASLAITSYQNIIYETLRKSDPSWFVSKFGRMFESYVEAVLDELEADRIGEDELEGILGGDTKVVDFMLIEDDACILIDAKGVELSSAGMLTHLLSIATHQVRSSIVRGIEQGFSVATKMEQCDGLRDRVYGRAKYLLIVSYKDLFLGSGLEFCTKIAEEKVEEIARKYGDEPPVPFEHIYFLSVEDLELLVAVCSEPPGKSVSGILRMVVEREKDVTQRAFVFRQHIQKQGEASSRLRMHKAEFERFTDRCKRIVANAPEPS